MGSHADDEGGRFLINWLRGQSPQWAVASSFPRQTVYLFANRSSAESGMVDLAKACMSYHGEDVNYDLEWDIPLLLQRSNIDDLTEYTLARADDHHMLGPQFQLTQIIYLDFPNGTYSLELYRIIFPTPQDISNTE